MKKIVFIILILISLLGNLESSTEALKELVGKTVKIWIGGPSYRIGVVTGVDERRIHIKKSKERWVRQIMNSDRDMYIGPLYWKKLSLLLIEEAREIYLMEEGKPDILCWEELDMDSREIINDPNQDLRVDRSNPPKFKTRTISKLKSAKGWVRSSQGNWVSDDFMPTGKTKAFRGLMYADDYFRFYKPKEVTYNRKSWLYLWRQENIIQLGGKTIDIKDLISGKVVYSIEVEQKRGGGQKNIFWVFSKEDLEQQLQNTKDGQSNLIKLKLKLFFDTTLANMRAFWEEKPERFEKPLSEPGMLYIHFRPFKERNLVQFLIFPWPAIGRDWSGKILPHMTGTRLRGKAKEELEAKLFEMITSEKLFDNGYFETSYDEFNAMFKFDKTR